MDYLLLLIGILVGAIIGYLVAKLNSKSSGDMDGQTELLKHQNTALEAENMRLSERNESIEAKLEATDQELKSSFETATKWRVQHESLEKKLTEQKAELDKLQEKFTKDFELIASKLLDEKSEKFTVQNKSNIDAILKPLKEKIGEFQKKVEESNEKNAERASAMATQLEMLRTLNEGITQETQSLTQALRGDSKAQGNWGEFQLESILSKAGLEKDIHYTKETNLKTEDGQNQRLDFIINLPDGKHLIIDSKVSLTAYSNYFDAEDEQEEKRFLKQHLDSVHTHIKLLSGKDYQKLHGIQSPDYVLMFIANEPALNLALREDQSLFEKALDKNIVLVSTSTLLATLRTISYIWKQDLQNKNAEEIARQAGNLYDKFVGFTDDLLKLGDQMNTAKKTYDAAMNKMVEGSGNLTKRIETLKKLGVNPSKNIDSRLLDRSED